ncbi:hypothetical protein PG991_003496 [Apiospora marii]|uniref:Heterokaryon incompatibility domain-containing protein n=1 Tax=Apiospora marii TaxID=335849 RepID=A0ABR1S3M6_9PEZI
MYSPLGKNGIRLLFIKPAVHDEQIECALTTVDDIDDAPDFEAISYLWGQDLSPSPILCNGAEKTVTRNLEEALRGLRPPPNWDSVPTWPPSHPLHSGRHVWRGIARNRYEQQENTTSLQTSVWIDALCINQDDPKERAQQVKMMGQIYRRASTVKIWLGNEAHRPKGPIPIPTATPLAHHHLSQYGDMPVVLSFLAQALRNPQDEENSLLGLRPTEDRHYRNHVHGLLHPFSSEWDILRDFFANPYFQRVWIVQEVVVARRAVAILGDWHLDWAALGQAASWFARNGGGNKDMVPVGEAAALWDAHNMDGKRMPLLDLLKDFRLRKAGQDVDRLYATLGIAEETADLGLDLDIGGGRGRLHSLLEPDYEKPLMDVYRDATRYLMVTHGSLRVLCHVDNGQTKTPNWPSWVPDWRQAKTSSEIWDAEGLEGLAADGHGSVSFGAASHENRLSLRGRNVDRIRTYSVKLESYGIGHVTYMQERDFVQAAWKMTRRNAQEQGEEEPRKPTDMLVTFVKTLTAGVVRGRADDATQADATPKASMADALSWLSKHFDDEDLTTNDQPAWAKKGDAGRFHEAFVRVCTDRRFCVTNEGRIGIGPEGMAEGDRVVVFFGSRVPFLVREVGPRYRLVGECYVAGLMEGQAMTDGEDLDEVSTEFEIE